MSGLVVAHGGLAGGIAEAFVGLAVVGIFVAIWLRERSARREEEDEEVGADLSDPDEE
jgi:uncharacterized membrane protein